MDRRKRKTEKKKKKKNHEKGKKEEKKSNDNEEEETFVLIYSIGVRSLISGRVIQHLEEKGFLLTRSRLTNVDEEFADTFMDDDFWKQLENDINLGLVPLCPRRNYLEEKEDDVEEFNGYPKPSKTDQFGGDVLAMTFKGRNVIHHIHNLTNTNWWDIDDPTDEYSLEIYGNMIYSSGSVERADKDIKLWFGESSFNWLHDYNQKEIAWCYPLSKRKPLVSDLLLRKNKTFWVPSWVLSLEIFKPLKLVRINRKIVLGRHVGDVITKLRRGGSDFIGMRLVDDKEFVKNEKELSSAGLKKDDLPVVIMVGTELTDEMIHAFFETCSHIDRRSIKIEPFEKIYTWFRCGMVVWPSTFTGMRASILEG